MCRLCLHQTVNSRAVQKPQVYWWCPLCPGVRSHLAHQRWCARWVLRAPKPNAHALPLFELAIRRLDRFAEDISKPNMPNSNFIQIKVFFPRCGPKNDATSNPVQNFSRCDASIFSRVALDSRHPPQPIPDPWPELPGALLPDGFSRSAKIESKQQTPCFLGTSGPFPSPSGKKTT